MLLSGGNHVTKRLVHELLYFLWYLLISHSMTFEDNYLKQVLWASPLDMFHNSAKQTKRKEREEKDSLTKYLSKFFKNPKWFQHLRDSDH